MKQFDLVIRGGTVVDGSGEAPFAADVAIRGPRIVAVGEVSGEGEQEIDARGKLVTPGFVDIHTHYDGQLVWASRLAPSSQHGVTTVVTGNCGVGFAPCRVEDRHRLIELMEGVEDLPQVVMQEGLTWEWETFPDYLDLLARREYDVDIAAQLPHCALRLYVMGDRAVARSVASDEDNARMAALTREAMLAGAVGFGTSRTLHHKTGSGDTIPSHGTTEAELTAIAMAMKDAGHGVLELVLDTDDLDGEFEMLRNVARKSGRRVNFAVVQFHDDPDQFREMLRLAREAREEGLSLRAQITPRAQGVLMGLETSLSPFSSCPSFRELEGLPLQEKVKALRQPERRQRILEEHREEDVPRALNRVRDFNMIFPLGDPPDYAPPPERSLASMAGSRGVSPEELAYDLMLEDEGAGLLIGPFVNYADRSMDAVVEMLHDSGAIIGLGDGGAHYGSICDASYTTFMLDYWTRGAGENALPLPWVIRSMTSDPAEEVGLHDRGRVAPGYKADLNVIDYDRIGLRRPRIVHDLPAGGGRLLQDAEGFAATILSGVVTYRDGKPTDRLPGRLIRGPQTRPTEALIDENV